MYDSRGYLFYYRSGNFPIVISQKLMVSILISNVRVRRTRSGLATYIDKQHHRISTDIFSQLWGIELDKENFTIQSTTQENVRSALKPLTWWYRTDFLSHIICRLNSRFYTDTLFAKDNSIVRNTCAQIFIYG